MPTKSDIRVHLDHLIPRESLRWVDTKPVDLNLGSVLRSPLTKLRFSHLTEEGYSVFPLLRKPDFQRETSAWTPEDCVTLLESIVDNLIVPSLIVWRNPENGLLYVLDGAHRISVVRAWMLDDWGDKAREDYYERHEFAEEIKTAAKAVREQVKARLGSYQDFVIAGTKYLDAARQGLSTKDVLSDREFRRGRFFTDMRQEAGFHLQEVAGDYNVAEASFLRINRSGQPLRDWETTLIANRNSSLARAVMSIANGGAGHYWPEDAALNMLVNEMRRVAESLHHKLFIPPLQTPIKDANVPFIAGTSYFPKHANLLELLPVVKRTGDVEALFESDKDADPETIVRNGRALLVQTQRVFQHLTSDSADPVTMSIVPLFYFYTRIGRYVRSSLYGFASWISSGNDEDIRVRKVIFSAHRRRFEQVIFDNDIPGAITRKIGSGVRATEANVQFYQQLLELLVEDPSDAEDTAFQARLKLILDKLTAPRLGKMAKEGRRFDDSQKTTINLREIFKSAIRCEICGGVLDLRSGVQYDHKTRYAERRLTDTNDGRPTHPFCNNQRDLIENFRAGKAQLNLPSADALSLVLPAKGGQMSLFSLFDSTAFPDEDSMSFPDEE
jgi:hypothetical protein